LLLVWFLLLIYLLGSTAENFFSPALSTIADTFKMSPTLAGVTLLAFGNGAPDVFASMMAAHKLKLFLAVGALVGAGLFVTTVVVFAVILYGGEAKMPIRMVARDAGFYLFALGLLLLYGILGEVNIWCAMVFPILYVFYVGVVVATERKVKPLASEGIELMPAEENGGFDMTLAGVVTLIEDHFAEDLSNEIKVEN
jgi:sodium/potassium/calcium exchanger 6